MKFGNWIRNLLTTDTIPLSTESKSVLEHLQSIEGQPNHYLWNGYFIELGIPITTENNGGYGLWIYGLYEYSELEGKGKQLGMWTVKEGDRQDVLQVACYHIDLLILKKAGIPINQ